MCILYEPLYIRHHKTQFQREERLCKLCISQNEDPLLLVSDKSVQLSAYTRSGRVTAHETKKKKEILFATTL